MSSKEKPSVFQSLLDRAKNREPEPVEELAEETGARSEISESPVREIFSVEVPKRGPGRPRGRRSNPDYTQISAYVPLDLYLDIQTELLKERRQKRQRTAKNVSELTEELLRDWLKQRKTE